jgi:hypothetical protein
LRGTSFGLYIFDTHGFVDYSVEISTRCSFVMEFIIPKFYFGIIDSIRKLHLVGISTE